MFEIVITATAEQELANIVAHIRRQAPHAALPWLHRMLAAIQTLRTMPERCGRAAEADAAGLDVREFLFGRRRGTFRVLFTIHPGLVQVRHIRRAIRGPVPPGQF